jgi:hypothetical protein
MCGRSYTLVSEGFATITKQRHTTLQLHFTPSRRTPAAECRFGATSWHSKAGVDQLGVSPNDAQVAGTEA